MLETSPGNHQCFILFDNPMKAGRRGATRKSISGGDGADFTRRRDPRLASRRHRELAERKEGLFVRPVAYSLPSQG